MSPILDLLKEKWGDLPGVITLSAAGWRDISSELFIAPKAEYCKGVGIFSSWPEGFAELVDGRVVYRGFHGGILLAPAEFQPETVAEGSERERLYREAMTD